MIFLGPLYDRTKEKEYIERSAIGVSNAVNKFQYNVIDGLLANQVDITIVNVLPVGVWPRKYSQLLLKSRQWSYSGCKCFEVGCVNFPFFKQLIRERKVRKLLAALTKDDKEVMIYSTYLPFMKAAAKAGDDLKITLIVTDLPEYYDASKVSLLKVALRKLNNKMIYSVMDRVDRFILLTEAMKRPLQVGERPYVVIEGVAESNGERLVDQTYPLDEQKEIVFYSGSLQYRVGILPLLDAFNYLDRPNLELWICGSGKGEADIKQRAQKDDRIKFYGFLPSDEVDRLRAKATVLINPRDGKGEYTKYSFPSKTMEYMASGIPVIMHKLPGVPDEYDEHLFYIDGDDPKDMARTIERVLDLPVEQRRAFGQAARAFVVKEKSAAVQMKKVKRLIEGN